MTRSEARRRAKANRKAKPPEPKPRLGDRSDEERAEDWLIFNLRLVHRDHDILQVGRMEDHRGKVFAAKYSGDVPKWIEGRDTWRTMRELADLSRQQLADKLGIDRASISRYESGARWPDHGDYIRWLKEAYADYLTVAEEDVNLELLLRDGWMIPDPDTGETSVKWVPGLVSNDGDLEDVLAGLDVRVVQPWIDAGMPDSLEGHYRPEDRDQKRRSQ